MTDQHQHEQTLLKSGSTDLTPLTAGTIVFQNTKMTIKIDANGEFFVNEVLIAQDLDLYRAMRLFFITTMPEQGDDSENLSKAILRGEILTALSSEARQELNNYIASLKEAPNYKNKVSLKNATEFIIDSQCDTLPGNSSTGYVKIHIDSCRRCKWLKENT